MDTITAVALGTAIAGLLSPFLTALLNQPAFSSQTRGMIATGVAIVLGLAATAITGGFSLGAAGAAGSVLAVVGVSQTLYSVILKPTRVVDAINDTPTIPALNAYAESRKFDR
jgi:hypothetical protein